MKINVLSDIVPPESEKNLFTEGKIEELVDDELWEKIAEADFNIVNLECPLTKSANPMKKWGSSIKAAPGRRNLERMLQSTALHEMMKRMPFRFTGRAFLWTCRWLGKGRGLSWGAAGY